MFLFLFWTALRGQLLPHTQTGLAARRVKLMNWNPDLRTSDEAVVSSHACCQTAKLDDLPKPNARRANDPTPGDEQGKLI